MGTTTLMSLVEFERLDGPEHLELLKGKLIRLPPPQRPHMEICERLYERLRAAVERRREAESGAKLGKAHIEMGYLLPGDPSSWLRPDVSLTHPGQAGDRYYEGAPLMVFEVVSENDTARQLESKVAEYLAQGASEVWIIYPDTHHAWVYRRGSAAAARETQSIRSELLPGTEIALDDVLY
jgi:Uma2 family endonuclease